MVPRLIIGELIKKIGVRGLFRTQFLVPGDI